MARPLLLKLLNLAGLPDTGDVRPRFENVAALRGASRTCRVRDAERPILP